MASALTLPETELILRLGVASILGALVGLERERLERAAGLRTHALVSVSSALMMIVSAYGFVDAVTPDRVSMLDPSRLAAQVVTGIGFLGAGVIIFQKNRVRGLTTAASIWSVAGIGLAAGGGLFLAAGVGTLFVLVIQAGLRPLSQHYFFHHQEHRLALRLDEADTVALVEGIVAAAGVDIRRLRLRFDHGGKKEEFQLDLDLGTARNGAIPALLTTLRATEGVRISSYIREPAQPAQTGDDGDDEGGETGFILRRPTRLVRRSSAPRNGRSPSDRTVGESLPIDNDRRAR